MSSPLVPPMVGPRNVFYAWGLKMMARLADHIKPCLIISILYGLMRLEEITKNYDLLEI
jgi:hypothetical protein